MWNECGGGRRYSSDDDEHSRQQRRTAIEDQQQLDAVSALALFSQTGYSSPSSRAAPVGSQDLGVHRYPSQPLSAAAATAAYPQHPQSGSMGRHFSDTLSQNPTASSEYGVRQYHRSESEPPQRAPRNVAPHQPTQYYHHETSETSGLGSYHQASISTYREPSEVTLGSYRRGPSNYEDDYHRRTEMNATRRADFHRSQGHDDDRRASSGPVSAYPRRHEAVASELLARGPTTYGRQLLPLSSYHQEEGAGRGPRLSSSCSFPLDEHQGRNPEGRGRPYAPPSRYHGDLPNDHDRSYCDITFRQPIVLLNNDHHGTGGFPSEQRHNTEDGDDNNVTALKHRSQHPRPYHRSVDGAEVEELPYHRNASTSAPLYDQTEFPTYKSGLQHVRTEPGDTVEALDKHRDSAQLRPGLREAQDINSEKSEHCQQQASGKVPANDGRPMDQRESYTGYVVKRPNQQGEAQGSLIQNEAFAHDWKANVEEIASVPIRPTQGEHAKGTTQPGLVLNDSQVEKESEENSDDHENVELDGDEEGESAGSEEVLDDNCSQDHVYAEAQKVQTLVPAARGKPEAAARALAAAKFELDREKEGERRKEKTLNFYTADPPKKKSPIKSVSSKKSPTKRLNSRTNTLLPNSLYSSILTASSARREFLLGETVPAIKEAEYENLQELMTQLCRVPLLAEFSRPVSILHPEVTAAYSKIISGPVDLGHVCRGIRRRHYKNCRDVRLDVWRVFSNCVKYNSHPSNKDAVPSFVSIALHLREYFNNLWQEYMLPSDPPLLQAMTHNVDDIAAQEVLAASFAKRDEERKKRLENSGVLVLSKTFTTKASSLLLEFIENGGCVDGMDKEPLFGPGSGIDDTEVDLVIQRLGQYHAQLEEVAQSGSVEYTLDAFYTDLSNCYTDHVFEGNPSMGNRFRFRLDRFFWKQAVPLHEANSRGVTQSSIWGNLAATIWARESSKKPFWPALCLGILPPAEQREGWHQAVTERNEGRLPEKLRGQLMIAKKRCEQAQKRQSLSYFLVEFLGTHEFIWVRETDIIENFDPSADPNKSSSSSKKSRSSRHYASNVVGSKTYATALQECVWANEEYENVLQDAFDNSGAADDDEDDEEMNYSFHVLAQSDEEADEEDTYGYHYNEDDMATSDVDEANWLISHDGMLDASTAGRKNAKKRTQAMKKKPSSKNEALVKKEEIPKKNRSKSKEKKDVKATENVKDPKEKERGEKKEQREVDKRRKKRMREHEKSLRHEARKKTKRRRSISNEPDKGDHGLTNNKRARATAIVKAYLTRMAKNDDCKSLALSGVMTMPAALVDSTGLLGMALAFRAASGELSMPDDGIEQLGKLKPWTEIDTEKPNTSAERSDNLQKQIELLQLEIGRVRKETEERKLLASEYVSKRLLAESLVEADDLTARHNNFKKKKKPTPSKMELAGHETPSKCKVGASGRLSELETDRANEMHVDDDATVQIDEQSTSDPGDSVDAFPDRNQEPDDCPGENVAEAVEFDSD